MVPKGYEFVTIMTKNHGSKQGWQLKQKPRAPILTHKQEAERANEKWCKSLRSQNLCPVEYFHQQGRMS